MPSFTTAQSILRESIPEVAPAAQLVVRWRGEIVHAQNAGVLDPETDPTSVRDDARFDLASVTKLFVTAAFMRQVEAGAVTLDSPVSAVLPGVSGVRPIQPYEDPLQTGGFVAVGAGGEVDAGAVTFRQLLTHTSGLPAWRPLFREADADAARALALATHFSYMPDTRIIYSDIGLILLGLALERLVGLPLEAVVARDVTGPLGLSHTGYRPAPPTWRSRRPSCMPGANAGCAARYTTKTRPTSAESAGTPASSRLPSTWLRSDSPSSMRRCFVPTRSPK